MAPEFAQQYADIRKQVRVYLRGMFRSNIDIDEVTDAVMEKLLRHWNTINEPLRWAITAAKRLALDALRKAAMDSLSKLISREVVGYGNTDQQLRVIQILAALQRLPPSEQKVMTLLMWGYNAAEIARILQLSHNSVYHYVCDARKKLGQTLPYSRRRPKKSRRSGPATGPELAQ